MSKWRYINEEDVSASMGLASDDYLTNIHTENEPSEYQAVLKLYNYSNYNVLVGRFQNIAAEIDIDRCKELGFGFGRRLTGGGAILMGEDQLGICFTTNQNEFPWEHISELYKAFSEPIIAALKELGIEATFRSKNDIEVNGKKIAGLGVYINPKGGIQFHASLLLDLDINIMLKVLQIPIQKYSDKRKVASIEQRITTIRKEGPSNFNMADLKTLILKNYSEILGNTFEERNFSVDEGRIIQKIAIDTYESEDWIYQRSPQPDMTGLSINKTPAGLLRTYIGLKGENIKSVLITGDFLDQEDMFAEIESKLKWSPLDKKHISKVVEDVIADYTSKKSFTHEIAQKDIVNAIWIASQKALVETKYTYNGSCYYPKVK